MKSVEDNVHNGVNCNLYCLQNLEARMSRISWTVESKPG
jgi:hypothetical protein